MSFSKQMRKWADKTGASVDQVARASLFQLSGSIIKRNPVGDPDTWESPPPPGYIGGTSRGNWFASINAPVTTPDYTVLDNNGDKTISKANVVIQDAIGEVFYLTNNMPYIGRLEYEGWSLQAPNGMVRISLAEFEQALKKAVSDL